MASPAQTPPSTNKSFRIWLDDTSTPSSPSGAEDVIIGEYGGLAPVMHLFPSEQSALGLATKVAERSRGAIDWALELQMVDDATRREGKVLADKLCKLVVR